MADVVGAWPPVEGKEDERSPWTRLDYPWKWAPSSGKALRATGKMFGLTSSDPLIQGCGPERRPSKVSVFTKNNNSPS
jgi:hypothetical protein